VIIGVAITRNVYPGKKGKKNKNKKKKRIMKQSIFKNYPCRLEEEEKHICPSFLISLNFDISN